MRFANDDGSKHYIDNDAVETLGRLVEMILMTMTHFLADISKSHL